MEELLGRTRVHVHYYNGHSTISIDKHLVVHMEKDENYVTIVAEELLEDCNTEMLRYIYPRSKIIKIVERV